MQISDRKLCISLIDRPSFSWMQTPALPEAAYYGHLWAGPVTERIFTLLQPSPGTPDHGLMSDDWRPSAPVERRSAKRFPIEQEFTFRILRRNPLTLTGNGQTVNLSRKGLLLRTDRPLRSGDFLKMSVQWPVLLNGTVPLKLVASGRVVWATGNCVAAKIQRYKCRTRGTSEWPT